MTNEAISRSIESSVPPPSAQAPVRKSTCLRALIERPQLDFLMEAHNGLSAKIVEEAGFSGIWGSGLAISAALGVRDNNEASWTQVLDVAEFMADAANIPILLDGDTGYGNFNSMRRLVRKLEQRSIAGVCIEDKLFPKTNSFLRSATQPLADPMEFAGKIRAAKESQSDPDFIVVARVEALIAGHGLEEALRRAALYADAGADAILIHSAKRSADEIVAFMERWDRRLPVVIVPTKYYETPTDVFRQIGVSVVIWANHVMRSALSAMQGAAQEIFSRQHVGSVESRIAPMGEVFRIQGDTELQRAEELYLPRSIGGARAIVLAASRGEELGRLTRDRPKCMVKVGGKPILSHIANAYRATGIHDITVVRGYKKDAVQGDGLSYVDNEDYDRKDEIASLKLALDGAATNTIVSYGDVLFRKYVALKLLDHAADLVVAIDADWQNSNNRERLADYAQCSLPNGKGRAHGDVLLTRIVSEPATAGIQGEWMGLLKIGAGSLVAVTATIEELSEKQLATFKIPDLLNLLIERGHHVHVVYTTGDWLDVDSLSDVVEGGSLW